jgi:hypothetical protein
MQIPPGWREMRRPAVAGPGPSVGPTGDRPPSHPLPQPFKCLQLTRDRPPVTRGLKGGVKEGSGLPPFRATSTSERSPWRCRTGTTRPLPMPAVWAVCPGLAVGSKTAYPAAASTAQPCGVRPAKR